MDADADQENAGIELDCVIHRQQAGMRRGTLALVDPEPIARRSGSEERGDQDGESVSRRDDDRRDDCRAQEFCLL
ncbi:hypothetical protein [Bradyrhizobium elkanii]|uniref:hypothetical protein n=1 Tax=Bradyrhizobium elkanii TaxID=29448 RepID=UPI0035159D3E